MTTLPTGTQYWETADYGGNLQRNLNISLIAISTVFFGIKLYVRAFMTKSLGWDDAVAFLAYVRPSTITADLILSPSINMS